MAERIRIGQLTDAINKAIQDKGKEVEEKAMIELNKSKDFALNEIKVTAPRDNRNVKVHLADSFIAEKLGSGVYTYYRIYSKEHGPLVHLVEFGFVHYKTTKFVKGQPFMLPALDKASNMLVNNIKDNVIK